MVGLVQTILGVVIFGNRVTVTNASGIILTLLGSALYSMDRSLTCLSILGPLARPLSQTPNPKPSSPEPGARIWSPLTPPMDALPFHLSLSQHPRPQDPKPIPNAKATPHPPPHTLNPNTQLLRTRVTQDGTAGTAAAAACSGHPDLPPSPTVESLSRERHTPDMRRAISGHARV